MLVIDKYSRKISSKIFFWSLFISVLTSPAAAIESPQPKTFIIQNLSAETTEDSTIVSIQLDRKPEPENFKLEDHGTFLQIALDHATLPNPGKFVETKSPIITKMVGFQTTQDSCNIRFFVNQDAYLVRQAIGKIDVLDSRISFALDHKKLASLVQKDPSVTAQTPEKTLPPTVVEHSSETPSDKKAAPSSWLSAASFYQKQGQLNQALIKAAAFCAIMLFGMLLFYLARPYLRKKFAHPHPVDPYAMKVLASHKIHPRQKIELFEIAGEKILLAITPNGVQYLTTIHQQNFGALDQPRLSHGLNESNTQTGVKQLTQGRTVNSAPSAKGKNIPAQKQKNQPAVPTETKVGSEPQMKSSIEVRVGENIDINYGRTQKSRPPSTSQQSISDVTRLIREKLKNLPSV